MIFDYAATWLLKANIIRGRSIPGGMVWAISQDDKDGTNIKAMKSAVGRKQMDLPNFTPTPIPCSASHSPSSLAVCLAATVNTRPAGAYCCEQPRPLEPRDDMTFAGNQSFD